MPFDKTTVAGLVLGASAATLTPGGAEAAQPVTPGPLVGAVYYQFGNDVSCSKASVDSLPAGGTIQCQSGAAPGLVAPNPYQQVATLAGTWCQQEGQGFGKGFLSAPKSSGAACIQFHPSLKRN